MITRKAVLPSCWLQHNCQTCRRNPIDRVSTGRTCYTMQAYLQACYKSSLASHPSLAKCSPKMSVSINCRSLALRKLVVFWCHNAHPPSKTLNGTGATRPFIVFDDADLEKRQVGLLHPNTVTRDKPASVPIASMCKQVLKTNFSHL